MKMNTRRKRRLSNLPSCLLAGLLPVLLALVADATTANAQNAKVSGSVPSGQATDHMVMVQAQAMSYVDAYWLLAVTCALMFLLCFLLAKNEPGKGVHVAVH